MDIRLIPDAEPTPVGARGGRRRARAGRPTAGTAASGGSARPATPRPGGHAARARRHLLLPALRALQEQIGWISPGGLNDVCRRLTVPPADAYGVATFYALFATEPRPARVVHVCEDLACRCNGSEDLIAQLEERFGAEGELSDDGSATWFRSPCLGQCDRAPTALLTVAGAGPRRARRWRRRARDDGARRSSPGGAPPAAAGARRAAGRRPGLRLLRRVGRPPTLDDYRAARRLRRRCAARSSSARRA